MSKQMSSAEKFIQCLNYNIALSFLMGVGEVEKIAEAKSREEIESVMMDYLRKRDEAKLKKGVI